MSNYIVSFKEGTSADAISKVKSDVTSSGGKILHEYTLIPGFSATLPAGHVSTLSSHPDVEHVEADQEVKTQ